MTAARFLILAALLHGALTLWMFSRQDLVPSDFSEALTQVGSLIGFDHKLYEHVMDRWAIAASEERQVLFADYLQARLFDLLRDACMFTLLVTLFLLVFYILRLVLGSLLGTFLAPLVSCWRALVHKTAARGKIPFARALVEMRKQGIVSTFDMGGNLRYHKAHAALTATEKQVKETRSKEKLS